MSSIIGEKDRKIVPRWRGSRASISDLQTKQLESHEEISASLTANLSDWRRERDLWTALDLVAGAIVEDRIDLVDEAILQIRLDPQAPRSGIALLDQHVLRFSRDEMPNAAIADKSRQQIRLSRVRLAEYPFDAIEWMDLAHAFTTLGIMTKAARCVSAALKLAPSDVFVLRSASRFFIQQDDPQKAQWILTKSPRTLKNPWLLASEIAAASVVGRESLLLTVAKRMELGDFSPSDLTELRAAIATSEIEAGSNSRAKKLLRRSLQNANENSLAQIQWLDRTRLGNLIDISQVKPPGGHEASAWGAFFEGKWAASATAAVRWFEDQPFSVNAGVFCSYLLSDIVGMYQTSIDVLHVALGANGDNYTLKNNLAYTQIQMGNFDEAARVLSTISIPPENADGATIQATMGLLAFRKGQIEEGRLLYEGAIERLTVAGQSEHAARAATYLALEEVKNRTEESLIAVKKALELTQNSKRADVKFKIQELQAAVNNWTDEEQNNRVADH